MNKILIALLFLTSTVAAAQSNQFKEFPVQGKISKYEIVKMGGDSLNEKVMPIEEVTYDKNGYELIAKYYDTYSNHIDRLEQSTIIGKTITTFECECSDLSNFIKAFVVRDKAELKNQLRGATNNPPTEYCTVKTLDKKGYAVLVKIYSKSGYMVSEIKSTFDASKNLLNKVVYNFDDSISYTEKNTYNKKGSLTQRVSKRMDELFERKNQYTYDAKNELTEELTFENGKLKRDYTYSKSQSENKTIMHVTDKLKVTNYIQKEIVVNKKNQEVKTTQFFSNGELQKIVETEYFENGKTKTKLIYNSKKELTSKILFADDKYNNWQDWTTYHRATTVIKDTKTTERKATTYRLKLEFLK